MIRILMMLVCAATAVAQDTVPVTRKTRPNVSGPSARTFKVAAADNDTKMVMLRWARRLTTKLESRLGTPAEFNRRSIWIDVRDELGEPDATCWQKLAFGEVQQNVIIRHVDEVERDIADAAFCRAILMGYLNTHWRTAAPETAYRDWIGTKVPAQVPQWLCRALARGLHSKMRADDSARVVQALEDASLPSLETFFEKVARVERDSLSEAQLLLSMGTELVEWLLGNGDTAARFNALVETLASGSPLDTAWMIATMPGATSEASLQGLWEAWISKYEHRILTPGVTRPVDMEKLDNLLQMGASSGFQKDQDGKFALQHFRGLLKMGDHPALNGFVVSRTHELRVMALGRSPEFADVVEEYCGFLSALRKNDLKDARERLSRAERKHDRLRRELIE